MAVAIDKTRQIVVDTETTGIGFEQGHRVIEIGCVEVKNRRLTGRTFHCYLNPERDIGADSLSITGITQDFLKDKPLFSDIAEELYEFIYGAELIAHNASFDVGFLNYEFNRIKSPFGQVADYCHIVDTLKLARKLHPGQRNSLDALMKRYNITGFNRDLHGALLDAEILTRVYLAMTGGQMTLMGLEAGSIVPETPIISSANTSDQSLRVIYADDEALHDHEKFLQMLHKESGQEWVW